MTNAHEYTVDSDMVSIVVCQAGCEFDVVVENVVLRVQYLVQLIQFICSQHIGLEFLVVIGPDLAS